MSPPSVQHTLLPGRLVISVTGVDGSGDLADLDVKEDCVTFLVKSERVLVELAPKTINTNDCSARFRKKDLVITWRDTEPKLQEPKLPEPKLPESPAPTELPEDESKVEFGLSAAVSWACGRLAVLKIPEESTGFQRFKAEVGLAELAFYGLRCGRLGLPAPLWPRLFAAEARLEAALQAAAAGDFGDTGEAIGFVLETLNRVAGAVCDVRLEVPEQPLLGVAETTQVSAGLAGSRWALRDGTLLGPGIGTWKLSPEQAEESVMAALREGVRHVDTAAEYGTEAAVARGIRNAGVARGDVFVNLKVAADSANELREVVASSMAKWGCGSVDCLMLHRPPPNDDELESVWRVLEEEVKAGRARMLGASNVTVQQLEVLSSTKRPESLWPAVVQLKCSMFHQGGYFIENSARLWQLLRQKRIIPVGISLFNSLHSCVSPLEEPMTHAWAAQLGSTSAELLATWARLLGVCPLLRCSPSHAPSFRTELHVSPQKVAALSCLAKLTETSLCPAPSTGDALGLKKSVRRSLQQGDHLQGRQVEVHSLRSADGQKLNGKRAALLAFEEDSGRWQVQLDSETKKIRPENLILLEDGHVSSPAAAAKLLKDLLQTGGADAMLAALRQRRQEVDWAFLETVSANLSEAKARGYAVKEQVLSRLLSAVKEVLAMREPTPRTVVLPPPALDATAWGGAAAEGFLQVVSALLDWQGYAVCDNFASGADVRLLAEELASYDRDFETAKIWVGKQATGAQLTVPTVRSDRIFWVCGEHRTHQREMLWDSAGKQPSSGLAPCRPEVVMDKSTHGFPRLTTTMNCVDDFILKGLSSRVSRLAGLAERSDAMVSIYENGSRFQKHVDNPNQDGRVLTSIVYLNTGDPWKAEDGGQLRMFLDGEPPIDLMPDTGRIVLFWADRIPHEVLPSKRRRMALTYWWFDRQEREAKVRQLGDAETQLQTKEERLAQEFIAFMLSETSKCEDIAQRAQALPKKSLDVVATVVGASNAKEALEGIQRLSQEDLERLRNSMGKMGL